MSFFIFVTAEGTANTAYSTQVTVTIACGASSGVQVATPATGTSQTVDVSGANTWFLITSVTNANFPDCPLTSVMFTVSSADDTPHPDLLNSASPTPVTGTTFQATPVDINVQQTITFTLKVLSAGGSVARFDYSLTLVCGPSTTGLVFIKDHTFAATMAHTFDLISGTTTQDLTFPVWTTSAGCGITKYELDTDAVAPLGAPTGVTIKAGCADPCNTLTF